MIAYNENVRVEALKIATTVIGRDVSLDWTVKSILRVAGVMEEYIKSGTHIDLYDKDRKIVCLCGSTQFHEIFAEQRLKLTLDGVIVLTIGSDAPDSMTLAHPDTLEGQHQKNLLDNLHLDKIRMSDEILVLNKNGYIGDSTRHEVAYAKRLGKIITWLYPNLIPEGYE